MSAKPNQIKNHEFLSILKYFSILNLLFYLILFSFFKSRFFTLIVLFDLTLIFT